MPEELSIQIARRAAAAGISPAAEVIAGCAAYVELLAKWNRKMNLTALPIDPPTDAAIDRLLLEPLAAARYLLPTDRQILDLGSGGGSPAIPMKIAAPWIALTMVEAREKKAAFLREAARALALDNVTVESQRLERLAGVPQPDVISLRAIKVNSQILSRLREIATAGTRLFWFRSLGEGPIADGLVETHRLALPGGGGELVVLTGLMNAPPVL